jgi:AcrR family transcriptional regulator
MRGAGVTLDSVVETAAELADQHGYGALTLAAAAARPGIRTPSLYNHVENLPAFQHHVAALAMTEVDKHIREAMLGRSGKDALAAPARALRAYVAAHPGRHTATTDAQVHGADDPFARAAPV